MKIISMTIKPLDSGVQIAMRDEKSTTNHAFGKATEAIDFITTMLLTHEKRVERVNRGRANND